MKLIKRKINLKINDIVKITAGNDKGKMGKVLSINRYTGKVQVEGVALNTRFQKVNPNQQKSAKVSVQKEGFIDISNIQKIELQTGVNNE